MKGYANESSLWKQAYSLPEGTKATKENAHFYRFASDELCAIMAERPAQILSCDAREHCIRLWIDNNQYDLVRKMFWETDDTKLISRFSRSAFNGHEDDFVAWFKTAMTDGRLRNVSTINPPDSLLSDHLNQINNFLSSNQFDHVPEIYKYHLNVELANVKTFKSLTDILGGSSSGFDNEPFEGKWAIAKSNDYLLKNYLIYNTMLGYPQGLQMLSIWFSITATWKHCKIPSRSFVSSIQQDSKARSVLHFGDGFGTPSLSLSSKTCGLYFHKSNRIWNQLETANYMITLRSIGTCVPFIKT